MYKEKTTKGFGDIAITNKGNSEFLIKVKDLIEWEKLNKILQSKLKRNKNAVQNIGLSQWLLTLKRHVILFDVDKSAQITVF